MNKVEAIANLIQSFKKEKTETVEAYIVFGIELDENNVPRMILCTRQGDVNNLIAGISLGMIADEETADILKCATLTYEEDSARDMGKKILNVMRQHGTAEIEKL